MRNSDFLQILTSSFAAIIDVSKPNNGAGTDFKALQNSLLTLSRSRLFRKRLEPCDHGRSPSRSHKCLSCLPSIENFLREGCVAVYEGGEAKFHADNNVPSVRFWSHRISAHRWGFSQHFEPLDARFLEGELQGPNPRDRGFHLGRC